MWLIQVDFSHICKFFQLVVCIVDEILLVNCADWFALCVAVGLLLLLLLGLTSKATACKVLTTS
jgi:hypothetical protein